MCSLIVRTTDQIHGLVKKLHSIALQGKKYAFAEDHSLLGYINDDPICVTKVQETFEAFQIKNLCT